MAQYNKKYLRGYMPKELTESTGTAKLLPVSPKGKISSKGAWKLQQAISEQLTLFSTCPLAEPGRQKIKRL